MYLNSIVHLLRYFVAVLFFGSFRSIIHCVITWFTFAQFFLEPQKFIDTVQSIFRTAEQSINIVFETILAFFGFFQFLLLIFLLDLTRLHVLLGQLVVSLSGTLIFIGSKKMTTIQYSRHLREQAKMQEAQTLQNGPQKMMWICRCPRRTAKVEAEGQQNLQVNTDLSPDLGQSQSPAPLVS